MWLHTVDPAKVLVLTASALLLLRLIRKGSLQRAAGVLALPILLNAHIAVLAIPKAMIREPLATGFEVLMIDILVVLIVFLFGSRRIGLASVVFMRRYSRFFQDRGRAAHAGEQAI